MRVLDLFSGIGGWTLGLHRAGFKTVAACEKDEWKRAQYQRLWPSVTVYNDVRELDGAELVRRHGRFDLIAGSPPCQHISSARAGGQKGIDGDGLFFEAIRLVNECRPDWVAFENSPHLRTRGADRIHVAFEDIGYASEPIVVGVGNAGAAHRRQRVWWLAWNTASEQRRFAGQSWGRQRFSGLGSHADNKSKPVGSVDDEMEVMPGSRRSRQRIGPVGAADIGDHVRAYDGLSARDAERIKHAYGDSISPVMATAIGRAIMDAMAA